MLFLLRLPPIALLFPLFAAHFLFASAAQSLYKNYRSILATSSKAV